MKLVLASSSPYRKQLLERLLIPFECVSPDIDERPLAHETPSGLVKRLAIEKARKVMDNRDDALIIGSDQVAVHGDQVVGKPRDHAHAVAQLQAASGAVVTLFTGVAVINTATGNMQADVIPFTVTFRSLSRRQIESYLEKEKPYGCAGSLRADGLGIVLLKRLQGDDPNALIGLPLIRLTEMLESEGLRLI